MVVCCMCTGYWLCNIDFILMVMCFIITMCASCRCLFCVVVIAARSRFFICTLFVC